MKRLLILPVILLLIFTLFACGEETPDSTIGACTHEYTASIVEPSCVEGYTIYTCKHCEASYTDNYVPAVGHSYKETYTDTVCNEFQTKTYTCSACGYSYDEVSDKKGTKHTYLSQRIEATEDKDAYILYTCTVCDYSYESDKIDENYTTSGLAYKNQNGKWYVSGLGTCKDSVIVIPSVNENGNTVSGILEGAITGSAPVTVIVREGVNSIAAKAFQNCPNLKAVSFPTGAVWQTGSIYDCPSLTSLTVYYNDSTKNLHLHRIATASPEMAEKYPDKYQNVFDINRVYSGLEELTIGGSFDSGYVLDYLTSVTSLTVAEGTKTLPSDAFSSLKGLVSVTLPSTLKVIGEFSFTGLSGLETVIMPDSVETIERNAFSGCFSLSKVVFSKSLKTIGDSAFLGCKALTELQLPNGVTTIEDYAFSGTYLESVKLPASVKTVGNGAFAGNEMLTSADLSQMNGVTLGSNLFQGCFALNKIGFPQGMTEIPNGMFMDCLALTSMTIPEGITAIGDYAFADCTALASVTWNRSLTTVGESAFKGTAIGSLTLPDTAQVLMDEAFASCTALKSVDLSKTQVTEIGNSAFLGCNQLSLFKLPETVKSLGKKALSGTAIESIVLKSGVSLGEEVFSNCTALESVTIENGITALPNKLFSRCTALESVTIPQSVTSFGDSIFSGCTSLTSATILSTDISGAKNMFAAASNLESLVLSEGIEVIPSGFAKDTKKLTKITIPSGVKVIGDSAFSGSAIESLILPKGLKTLDKDAFSNNTRLTSVDFSSADVSLGGSVFSGCTSLITAKNYEKLAGVSKTDIANTKLTKTEKGITHGLGLVFGYTEDISDKAIIPEGITVITASAFSGCKKLNSIQLPSTLKVIENNAFEGCTGLSELSLPSALTDVGAYAFKDCTGLTEVTMSDNVTELGSYAFSGCNTLKTVVLSDGLTALSQGLFNGCVALQDITLGKGLKSIHSSVFTASAIHNYTLRSVHYNGSKAEWNALSGHDATVMKDADIYCEDGNIYAVVYSTMYLQSYLKLTGDGTVVIYGEGPFSLNSLGKDNLSKFADRAPVKKVIVESGITALSNDIFSGCDQLTEVEFADTLISISYGCFDDTPWYKALTEPYVSNGVLLVTPAGMHGKYTIPKEVTKIGANAFRGQSGLSEIVLHSGITYIGQEAFYDCTGLTDIELPEGLQEAEDNIFTNCSGLTEVTVPASLTVVNTLFYQCHNLEKIVVLGEKGTERELFRLAMACDSLTTIIIGEGFTTIEEPFYSCPSVTTLVVPESCTAVTSSIFIYSPDCVIYAMNESVATKMIEAKRDRVYLYSKNKPTAEGRYWHYDDNGEPVIYS